MDSPAIKEPYGGPWPVLELQHHHFNVSGEPVPRQLLAWRERVGHVIDVLPSLTQVEAPFQGVIDRYDLGTGRFTDCLSDTMVLDRSVARISTDTQRDYVFQVFTSGGIESVGRGGLSLRQGHSTASIFVTDLNQPIRMQRSACRVLTFFVPRPVVDAAFPHAEAIHGRVFENASPLMQLFIEQVLAFSRNLPGLSAHEAGSTFDVSVQLLLAELGKQSKLSGNARAAVRAAMFDKARRYIKANLHQASLSPERLLEALQLPRLTLYRLFEHEGGLGAYIRNRRLREAADELVKSPNVPVTDIAYGLGFKSASDFSRAFRRTYEMAPQDLRFIASQRLRNGSRI
ncbi:MULTISPECIES: helix-turn-helix domain-containing protein [Pseudomonas]|uniref:Helix-turn-helix domain-containing protein n=1 Tax=Pseudomonas gingeri TaxID=117681 RepID=A0A7Y8BW36_9PSED|nr:MULTISPECIES: helix-turn-helix domain-containing protein [Pseudomonas]MPQ69614.1 helix-turn-helix domain-containing protein [Pseudomonas sp. MWU12-2323]NWB89417.1 helix-turn-helix domain-containing protein [Pseudomonas gingeri]